MTGSRRENPFRLPHGWVGQSQLPLRPHKYSIENDYYVGIDRTEESLKLFEREVTPEGVAEDGRLVLIGGREGSGKTSLLNRCVARFCEEVDEVASRPARTSPPAQASRASRAPQQIRTIVVDLVREDPRPASIPGRATEVCRRIVRELRKVARDSNWEESFCDRLPQIDRNVVLDSAELDGVHLDISDLLVELEEARAGRFLLVVMLPRCLDTPAPEVANYVRWVRPRLLFLMESSSYEGGHVETRGIGVPPLILQVGDLEETDGWLFVRNRLTRDGDSLAIPPTVTEETMTKVMQDNPSMARLQQLMYGVFSHVLSTDTPVDEITMEEIKEFTYRSWLASQHRNVGGIS
jgi:energy-coupling factor transporter ATP-binding protein EcfA2